MAKLAGLIHEMARVLKVPEGSVRLYARYLREAGFIRQGGRGPGAPNMTEKDAAALLLGIMASPQISESPEIVGKMWQNAWIGSEVNLDGEVDHDLPPARFLLKKRKPACLGDVIANIIRECRRGDFVFDDGLPVTNFSLEVEGRDRVALLELDSGDPHYLLRYELEETKEEKIARARAGGMRTRNFISLNEIHGIAEALDGYVDD